MSTISDRQMEISTAFAQLSDSGYSWQLPNLHDTVGFPNYQNQSNISDSWGNYRYLQILFIILHFCGFKNNPMLEHRILSHSKLK